MLDRYDEKILYHLDRDARMPASRIGRDINLSKEAVNQRIKHLKENGTIRQWYAIIDASKLGFYAYRIALKFYQSTIEQERELVEYLQGEKSCAHLAMTEGRHNVIFLAMHRTYDSLQTFFDSLMSKYGDIIAEKEIHVLTWHERHNQRHTYDGKRQPLRIDYDHVEHKALSPKRAAVLQSYAEDARKSIAQAAEELDQEPQSVRYHLKRLEDESIIKGHGSFLDLRSLGKQRVIIDITLKHPQAAKRIRSFFEEKPESSFTARLLGRYDLSVELIVRNDVQLRGIIDDFRSTYKEDYIDYDVSMCYEEYVLTWSPF